MDVDSTNIQQRRGNSLLYRAFHLYYDGFRNMGSMGRSLWLIILIKLFVMFAVLKLFFFPDILSRDYDSDEARAEAVRTSLLDDTRHR